MDSLDDNGDYVMRRILGVWYEVRADEEYPSRVVTGKDGKQRRERFVAGQWADDEVTVLKKIPPELRAYLKTIGAQEEEPKVVRPQDLRLQNDDDILFAAASMSHDELPYESDDAESYTPDEASVMPSVAFYGGEGKRIGWMDESEL